MTMTTEVGMQSEVVLRWTDWLRDMLVPLIRYRVERLGIMESGTYNFYNSRVQSGELFSDYDLALAAKLLSCGLEIRNIHEIGSGLGQLVFLLGWNGLKAVGFEADTNRARMAGNLHSILSLVDPDFAANIQLLNTEFPPRDAVAPDRHTLVLTTNLVATRSREQQLEVVRAMRKYPFVLTDVQRFFDLRPDPADEPAALALFAEGGFATPELFLDLGASGRYYLFTNH